MISSFGDGTSRQVDIQAWLPIMCLFYITCGMNAQKVNSVY